MTEIPSIRGMPDLFPTDMQKHDRIISIAQSLAFLYGFDKIQTPFLEPIEVFKRSVGETADIVSKEMYTLADRNDRALCLRPEGTASVIRAVINSKLTQSLPLKYFYAGPMFRYERPQKGRLRQFTQIGVEYLGDDSPCADVETIALGWRILQSLGLKNIQLEINSLGDQESRTQHRKALVDFYNKHKSDLSADSLTRLEKNPLRILDSKVPSDQALNKEAPNIGDYFTPTAQTFFAETCTGLDNLGIPYTLTPSLVRGLDYYCHTTFEFKALDLGAQSTVMAGGRYDGLAKVLGGSPFPSVGWAAGVDRMALLLDNASAKAQGIMVAPIGEAAISKTMSIGESFRAQGLKTIVSFKPTLKHSLKKADKMNLAFAVILGEDELKSEVAQVKNLQDGTQETVAFSKLNNYLKERS